MSLPAFLSVDSTLCDILRLIVNPDHAFGDPPGEYSVIAENVVCALDRSISMSNIYGGVGRETSIQGETNQESYKLFLLPNQDIISGDMVWVGTTQYKVTNVIPLSTQKECMLTLWS